jgi:hypothetical protein
VDPVDIVTIWRTAAEQCEVVLTAFGGYRVYLWVQNRLVVDEGLHDLESAVARAWELRIEWPGLV